MNLKEVQELISSVADSGMLEFKLNSEEVKIVVKTNTEDNEMKTISPISENNIVPEVAKVPEKSIKTQGIAGNSLNVTDNFNYCIVKSPFIGTFFLQSSPDKSMHLKIDDMINEGDVLCEIEALKLLNEVRSDVSGKVTQILVEDFSPVEYDQPLFVIAL